MENNKPWLEAKPLAELIEKSQSQLKELTNSNFKIGDAVKFKKHDDIHIGIVNCVETDGFIRVSLFPKGGRLEDWKVFIGDVIDKMGM